MTSSPDKAALAAIRDEMVRPLSWSYDSFQSIFIADSPFWQYQAWEISGHACYRRLPDHDAGRNVPGGLPGAFAAAQEHFNAAILSALNPAFIARMEALEAENALARNALKLAGKAIQPLADAVYNDNGDMTVSVPRLDAEQCVTGYFASKAIDLARTTQEATNEE